MKKYRIVKTEYLDCTPSYKIQKRELFFWWENMWFEKASANCNERTLLFDTYEEAFDRLQILKKTEIIKRTVVG